MNFLNFTTKLDEISISKNACFVKCSYSHLLDFLSFPYYCLRMQPFFSRFIHSQELLQVTLLITILAVSLFGLCGLSFVFGKKRRAYRSEFLKFWILIPLWLISFAFFVWIGQKITFLIIPDSAEYPLSSLVMSGTLGIIGFGFLSEFRSLMHIPDSDFFYSYFLSLVGLMNIILFSSLYLPFVIMFSVEFIIIYLSRTSSKPAFIIGFMLLMAVPFMPNFVQQWRNTTPYILLSKFTFEPSFYMSFLIACILLPFLLQFVRFLISLGLWRRISGSIFRNALTATLIRLFICSLIMIGVVVYIRFNPIPASTQNTTVKSIQDSGIVYAQYRSRNEYGVTIHQIALHTSESVSRYEISVSLSPETLIVYSETDFTTDSNSMIHFTVDNPESQFLQLEFTTSETAPGQVTITALDSLFYPLRISFE